ncbi:hypothetical protein ACFKI5_01605 [Schaalia turicensis]|uniref:hypothetical protein n=2 Tax=Actinotignum sanguinis TaxID=1445614 RepID=UPI00237DB54B|nr:hypothetical protein [Actinotignum sanguinis]MDE1552989.1 hypothetical protein [Actinotignum sanguinis]MDE1577477.1 hypothetical protein [Actinotignum sanguinis]
MRSTKLMAWVAGAVAALCGVAGLGGCGGGTTPQSPATHLPGAPGDTAQFPSEAIAHGTGEVKVRGGVIISGGVATMCDVFLESSPPQCGGARVTIAGLESYSPQELGLETVDPAVVTRPGETPKPASPDPAWGELALTIDITEIAKDGQSATAQLVEIHGKDGKETISHR